jgi:diacylglycerol kinase family enzyme
VDVVEARERGQTKDIARHLQTNGVSGVVVVGDDGTMQACYWRKMM